MTSNSYYHPFNEGDRVEVTFGMYQGWFGFVDKVEPYTCMVEFTSTDPKNCFRDWVKGDWLRMIDKKSQRFVAGQYVKVKRGHHKGRVLEVASDSTAGHVMVELDGAKKLFGIRNVNRYTPPPPEEYGVW